MRIKISNFSEEKEDSSTSNFNEKENIDDLMVEKIVKIWYEKLKKLMNWIRHQNLNWMNVL